MTQTSTPTTGRVTDVTVYGPASNQPGSTSPVRQAAVSARAGTMIGRSCLPKIGDRAPSALVRGDFDLRDVLPDEADMRMTALLLPHGKHAPSGPGRRASDAGLGRLPRNAELTDVVVSAWLRPDHETAGRPAGHAPRPGVLTHLPRARVERPAASPPPVIFSTRNGQHPGRVARRGHPVRLARAVQRQRTLPRPPRMSACRR